MESERKMHPLIEEIYASGKVQEADGTTREALPISIKYDEGVALHQVVRQSGAKRTLEIGMAFGLSSLFILQGLDENHGHQHTSIDPWQEKWWNHTGIANVQRAGYESLHRFYPAPSYEVLPGLLKAGEQFDFVFIDGNHRFEYVLMDFMYADRMLDAGGYLMLHDRWLPSIRKAVSFILSNRREAYALAPEYTEGLRPMPLACVLFVWFLLREPYELRSVRYFARRQFKNYVVFRKTRHIEREDLDKDWDFYRAF